MLQIFPLSPSYTEADQFSFFYTDGFFDAGMLLQALKANHDKDRDRDGNQKPHLVAEQRRRAVGKKLKLNEY